MANCVKLCANPRSFHYDLLVQNPAKNRLSMIFGQLAGGKLFTFSVFYAFLQRLLFAKCGFPQQGTQLFLPAFLAFSTYPTITTTNNI